ncbi:SDR family NAD(P)-dependent oxidoreductase [Cumulibacter manganitolerans]|uniref:SDR family NAD(P)-dependent oxidoreductase n=1 Tax=Cumulibacter manganitolerans TaxID=1884992 RepID=UPI0012969604|nr:SDR family NAD(P)-dependent oxidoreductase [Cumulibacter manganitolerans]
MSDELRTAVVVGATGGVGRQLCALLAADGVAVHAVARGRQALERVAAETGARPWQVDLTDEESAETVAAGLAEHAPELAIAAVGGWYVAEPGLRLPMATWGATLASNLTAHFGAARAFAPVLAGPRPVYLALNGIASHYPCEGSIAISVAGAGQAMMLDVLAAEGRDAAVSYRELVVDTPILGPGERHDQDEPTHTITEVYAAVRDLAGRDPAPGRVVRRHLG